MAKALSSLQFIEERIRRAFKMAGEIGTTFKPDAIPVVIVADVTQPGNNVQYGRRWAASFILDNAGAGGSFALKFQSPCIVDGWMFTTTVANVQMDVNVATPDAGADPYTIATANIPWSELRATNAERAPVLSSGAQAIGPIATTANLARFTMQASMPFTYLAPIQVLAGDRIFWKNGVADGTASLSIWGRAI